MYNQFSLNTKNLTNVRSLLIEDDAGFINPDEPRNQPFINEISKIQSDKLTIVEPLVLYVVLQKYGVINKNGRVYPEHVLRKVNELYQEAIRTRSAIGELNHPETITIDGGRVSHNIIETWWEGKTLMGKMEIIMTPGFVKHGIVSTVGDEVANIIRNRIRIGVSSRGVGSLKEVNGQLIVQDDFQMVCWDIVTQPSVPGSYMAIDRPQLQQFVEQTNSTSSPLTEALDNYLIGNKLVL